MQPKSALQSKLQLLGVLGILVSFYSCGSFQYVGNDNDGIYGDATEAPVETQVTEETTASNTEYYKGYFKEKTEQYQSAGDNEDVIFTDIDSYSSDYTDDTTTEDTVAYSSGYAGWGENNTDVSINIYGGHAFNSIYWNRPFVTSWGWGYGYYDPFWCPPYYGAGFYAGWGWGPWWNNYYYRPYHNYYGGGHYGYYGRRRSVAYNAGRRGYVASNSSLNRMNRRNSVARRSSSAVTRRSGVTRRGGTTAQQRPHTTATQRPHTTATRPTTRPTTRPRVNTRPTQRPKVETTRPSTRPRVNTTRPRVNTTRPRINNRPSSNYRSGGSRGGSMMRSSGRSGSSRSSGASRSRRNN